MFDTQSIFNSTTNVLPMVIHYEIDDVAYDRLITGNKASITTRKQIGEIGDTILIREYTYRIVDIWKSTHGFAREKMCRVEGMASSSEYDTAMAALHGKIYGHHWFYTHFIAPVIWEGSAE